LFERIGQAAGVVGRVQLRSIDADESAATKRIILESAVIPLLAAAIDFLVTP